LDIGHERLLYTRAARLRLQALPAEVRIHLETHMENLALLIEGMPPERLPQLLAHEEESFVTLVAGAQVRFVIAPAARALLIHRIEALPASGEAEAEEPALGLKGGGAAP
jgi:hypothetical protein